MREGEVVSGQRSLYLRPRTRARVQHSLQITFLAPHLPVRYTRVRACPQKALGAGPPCRKLPYIHSSRNTAPCSASPPPAPSTPPPPSIHRHTTLQSRDPKPLKLSSSPSTSWLGPSPLLAPLSAVACLSWSHQVPSWVFRSSPCCLTLLVVAFPAAVLAVLPGECECVCFCGRTLVFALPPDFGLWVLAPSCEWKNRRAESGRREKEGERKERKYIKKRRRRKRIRKRRKGRQYRESSGKSGRRKRKEKKNFMRRAVSVGWW